MSVPSLENRIAIVTGSNRGIGEGCALELARAGCHVAVNYNTHSAEGEEVCRQIVNLGRDSILVQCDVANRADCERLVNATLEKWGRVDILVNNAATSVRKPFVEQPVEEVDFVWGVCQWSVFHMSQLCARDMIKRADPASDCNGKIVVISSVLAAMPMATSVAYNSAKAAINQMANTMATELAQYRINVNVIEPGWTDTPGERRFVSEEQLQLEAKKLPWGRLASIEDIGKACVFLCSEDANYITAANLRIDGGYWLPYRRGL